MTLDDVVARIIGLEGGASDHHADRGGLTGAGGITRGIYAEYRRAHGDNRPVSDDDLHAMTPSIAAAICRWRLESTGVTSLHGPLLLHVADWTWHSGPGVAIAGLQSALNALRPDLAPIAVDGAIGPETRRRLSLLADASRALAARVLAARLVQQGRLIERTNHLPIEKRQAAFAHGWARRNADLLVETFGDA